MPSKGSRCWSRSADNKTVKCGFFLCDRSHEFYSRTYCFDRHWDSDAEFLMCYWPSEPTRHSKSEEVEIGIRVPCFGNQESIPCSIEFRVVDKTGACHYKSESQCTFRKSGRQTWSFKILRRILDEATRRFGRLDATFVIDVDKRNNSSFSSLLRSPKQEDVKQESFSSHRSARRSSSRSSSKESTDEEAVDVDHSTFVSKIPSIEKMCEFKQKGFDGTKFLLRYYPWNQRCLNSTCNFEFWVVDFGHHQQLQWELEWQLKNSEGKTGFSSKVSVRLQKQCFCNQKKCRCKPKRYHRIQPDELREFAHGRSVKLIFKIRRITSTETTDVPRDDPQPAINITSPAISLTSSNPYVDYFKHFSYNPEDLLSSPCSEKTSASKDLVVTPKPLRSFSYNFSPYPLNNRMEIEEEVDVNQNIGKGRCVHETPLNDAHNNQSPTNLQQPLITVLPATKPEPIEIVELSDDELDQPVNETTIEETILASKVDHLSSTKNDDDRVAQHLEHTQVPDVVVPTETVNQNENLENEKKEQDEKESIATESTTSSSEESEDSMSEESEYNPPEELEYDLSEESDRSSSTPKIRRSMLESTYHSIISSDDELAQPIKLTARKSVSGSLNSTASKNRRLTKKRLRVEESSDTEEEEKVECKLRRTNSKITITASGKAFEVDKTVLIEESNHFARECAKNDCLTSFNLDWIKKDVLNAVIQWMTNKHVDDLKNQAMKLYEAADKLDMAKLRGQCIESLKETCKTGNQAAHYIFAVKHNITDLQHEMDFIKRAPTKMAAFLNTPEMIKLIKDKETDLILKINKSFLKD